MPSSPAQLQEQRPRQAEHSWLGTPGRAGTGPPGSPVVPALQTKLLNPDLGHLSGLPFFLHFRGFMDPQQECWSQDIPVQTSTGIPTPPAVSEHTLGHQAAGCTTASISIGSYRVTLSSLHPVANTTIPSWSLTVARLWSLISCRTSPSSFKSVGVAWPKWVLADPDSSSTKLSLFWLQGEHFSAILLAGTLGFLPAVPQRGSLAMGTSKASQKWSPACPHLPASHREAGWTRRVRNPHPAPAALCLFDLPPAVCSGLGAPHALQTGGGFAQEPRIEPAKQRPAGASTRGRGEGTARFLARDTGSDSPEREEQQPRRQPPGR